MNELFDYLQILLMLCPLLFFIIAVGFRLLDNSGFLLLEKEIIVESSYVSVEVLQKQLHSSADPGFQKRLKRVMVYRNLHRLFLYLTIPAVPVAVFAYWYLF